MKELMRYNNYTYIPHRGNHNVFSPKELANLKAIDAGFSGQSDRGRVNQRQYYSRYKEKLRAYAKAYRDRKKSEREVPT